MLSLPLCAPAFAPTPFLPTPAHTTSTLPPPTDQNTPHPHRPVRPHRQPDAASHSAPTARSPLALLAADEAAIAHRKHAIRNFGALWMRPPGVRLTLQAMGEEEAERVEVEEMARQERGLGDLRAVQVEEEMRVAREENGEGGEEERDLDDEVPDAEDGGSEEGSVSGDEVSEDEVTGESFNEASLVDGSSLLVDARQLLRRDLVTAQDAGGAGIVDVDRALEMEEALLTGAARDEEDLGILHDVDLDLHLDFHEEEEGEERDLDDSIPEAGSYQHTDTEVEDTESSDGELQDSFAAAVPSARRSAHTTAQPSSSSSHVHVHHAEQARRHAGGGVVEGLRVGAQGLHARVVLRAGEQLERSPGRLHLGGEGVGSEGGDSSPVLQRGARGGRVRGGGVGRRGRGGAG
ncbi:hypothetical protein LTR08_005445 [Meristemomyces frigidus]|nr:hypothetical protein LTR08_005445 [Meristemomyces frigidus]